MNKNLNLNITKNIFYKSPILYIPKPRSRSNESPSVLKHLLIGLSVGYPSAIAHKISYLINYYKQKK